MCAYRDYLKHPDLFDQLIAIHDTLTSILYRFIDSTNCYMFSGAISEQDFVSHLAFEYYERAKINSAYEDENCKPLRQQFEITDGDEYEKAYKTFRKLIEEGGKHLKRLNLPDKRRPELLSSFDRNRESNFHGRPIPALYKKTIDNFSRNLSNRPLVPIFYQGLIKSSKQCSNHRLSSAYYEYFCELQSYANSKPTSVWLANAIDIFQMEENMHISLVYQLAQYMFINSISTFIPKRLQIFGYIPFEPNRQLQNNLVCFKHKLFPSFFADEETFQHEYACVSAMLEVRGRILSHLLESKILESCMPITSEHLLTTFFKNNYNLFSLIDFPENQSINPKAIKLMREISLHLLAPGISPPPISTYL